MKITALLIIFSLLSVTVPFGTAQTSSVTLPPPLTFDAEMLVPNGKNVDEEPVKIVLESDGLKIVGVKKPGVSKTIAYTAIKSAEYVYSKKPRYAAGAVAALAFGLVLLPLMFNKTKKHWLTINGENDFAVLKLQKSNYRMFLPALRSKSVNVLDLGDQNKRYEEKKDSPSKKDTAKPADKKQS